MFGAHCFGVDTTWGNADDWKNIASKIHIARVRHPRINVIMDCDWYQGHTQLRSRSDVMVRSLHGKPGTYNSRLSSRGRRSATRASLTGTAQMSGRDVRSPAHVS